MPTQTHCSARYVHVARTSLCVCVCVFLSLSLSLSLSHYLTLFLSLSLTHTRALTHTSSVHSLIDLSEGRVSMTSTSRTLDVHSLMDLSLSHTHVQSLIDLSEVRVSVTSASTTHRRALTSKIYEFVRIRSYIYEWVHIWGGYH